MKWTEPKTWRNQEAITPEKLNEQISQNLAYLSKRPSVISYGHNDAYSTTTSWAAIDEQLLVASLYTYGGDILLTFQTVGRVTAASGTLRFDVLIDDYYYLSSLTDTPLAYGVWWVWANSAIRKTSVNIMLPIFNISKGLHTYKMMWMCDTSAGHLKSTDYSGVVLTVREF